MALKAYIANPLYDSVFKFLLEDPRIDEDRISAILENDETRHIFDRLLYAATDQAVRDQMDIEDEFVSEVEEKDTKIMRLEDAVSRKDEQLAKSIKLLASAGVPEETISANLGIDISIVKDALK